MFVHSLLVFREFKYGCTKGLQKLHKIKTPNCYKLKYWDLYGAVAL
jgi:hypothetical protein